MIFLDETTLKNDCYDKVDSGMILFSNKENLMIIFSYR